MSVSPGFRQKVAERDHDEASAERPRKMTMEVSPELYAILEQLQRDTRQDLAEIFTKAIGLYKTAVDLRRDGKHVGVADEAEKLEGEFVGFGPPGSGI